MEGERKFIPSNEQTAEAETNALLMILGDLLPKMDSVPMEQIKKTTEALEKQLASYPGEKKDAFYLGAVSSLRDAQEQIETRLNA